MNITDQINSTNPLAVGQTAFAVTSGLQDHAPAAQVMGAAMFLLVMCEEFHLNPADMLGKAKALLGDADPFNQRQIAATRQLIREEYMK